MKSEPFQRKFSKVATLSNSVEIWEEIDLRDKKLNGIIKLNQVDEVGCIYSREINTNLICKENPPQDQDQATATIYNFLCEKFNTNKNVLAGYTNQLIETLFNVEDWKPTEPAETEKEEIKQIYFEYYDQLHPKVAKKAKENFEMEKSERNKRPKNIFEAVYNGFEWSKTKQGELYWFKIYQNLV